MSANAVVCARIDEHIKEEASTVLAAMGITVSDAFCILLTRVASEKALPFELLIPNETTIAAIREARAGNLKRVSTALRRLWRTCMRKIDHNGKFKRDYKCEAKGQIDTDLMPVVKALAMDQHLEWRHRDHPLTGDWKDHRDCHVKPDLVLIYRKLDAETLQLVRMGSHNELGL